MDECHIRCSEAVYVDICLYNWANKGLETTEVLADE
jgi:hypothetical protein